MTTAEALVEAAYAELGKVRGAERADVLLCASPCRCASAWRRARWAGQDPVCACLGHLRRSVGVRLGPVAASAQRCVCVCVCVCVC